MIKLMACAAVGIAITAGTSALALQPETSAPSGPGASPPAPATAAERDDPRAKGVIIKRDPAAVEAQQPNDAKARPQVGRSTKAATRRSSRHASRRHGRRYRLYARDPAEAAALAFAGIAGSIVGGALGVFGQPYSYYGPYGPVEIRRGYRAPRYYYYDW